MNKLPNLTGKAILKALKKAGFNEIRMKGSHHFLKHDDGRCTVVPVHDRETIGKGLFFQILKDCEMSREEFQKLL
jgi:predicted RNA binding protein YcfA (HicA-like mRNA interferase family)